ncbi:MAG: DUF4259 domain-containing protein [Fimbriiglobus sp.]
MGAWGKAAWDNDDAADWYHELFTKTKLATHVEKALNTKDLEERAGRIRAAAYILVALGRVYIWPIEDFERHLKLAIEKLEAISELEEYEGDEQLAAEIAELRSRLPKPTKRPAAKSKKGKEKE